MLTVTFGDGTQLPYLECRPGMEYWGGSQREALVFRCAPDAAALDGLRATLADPANLATLTLANDETGTVNTETGYTIPMQASVESVPVSAEPGGVLAGSENRLIVKLGRYTLLEALTVQQGNALEAIRAQAAYTAMMSDTLLEEE